MRLLVYDTECSGLDVESEYVQELAWAVYDTDTWRLLFSKSFLINWPTAYQVHPEAQAITGLSREFCSKHGRHPFNTFEDFLIDVQDVQAVCGHNAIGFDFPMMSTNIKRAMMDHWTTDTLADKIHIDTLLDCPFPSSMKIHSLKYLALDHGYILSDAHQAMADVFACKHILSQYPFEKVLEIARTKVITLTAKVDWNNLEGRERIKNARFYWEPKRKLWTKRIREYYVPDLQMKLGDGISLEI